MNKKLFYSIVIFIAIIIVIFSIDLILYIRLHKGNIDKGLHTGEIKIEDLALKRDNFQYKPLYNDPFITYNTMGDTFKTDSTREINVLTLKGVVFGPGEPVVVLEDINGNVSILKKNETMNDLRVISIRKDKVKVRYKKKDYTLDLLEE